MTTLEMINGYIGIGVKDNRISEIKAYFASLMDTNDPDIMKQVIFENMQKVVNQSKKVTK